MTQLEHLGALDRAFLYVEDGVSHMHIGSCAVFEGPAPDFDDFVDLLASKLPLVPRYRQRVRFVAGPIGTPIWTDDDTFDLAQHVRHTALASPHTHADLQDLMGWIMSQELDRQRPLWETWMVDELPDDQWALISKVHHCMVDGVAGTDLMARLLDTVRTPVAPGNEDTQVERVGEPSGVTLTTDALTHLAGDPRGLIRGLGSAMRAPLKVFCTLWAVAGGLRALGGELRPGPALSIQGRIGPQRRWAAGRAPLADAKAARRRFEVTVNDVVLAAITAAFRDILIDRGDDVGRALLRAAVPVSVRPEGDTAHNNQVAMMFARLPVAVDDPIARLHAVQAELSRAKNSHEVELSDFVTSAAGLTAPALLATTLQLGATGVRVRPQRLVTTIATNVPGPQVPLYSAGRQMIAYYPFVPLIQGVRIAVAIISYNGWLYFGVTADDDAIGNVVPFCRRIEHEIDVLRGLARPH